MHSLPPDERRRQYKAGSIRRVKLHNFLTYSDVEFEPGPRLNVVVGPNGTGKSTILCAICLGLGGQPPLLGRADDARTFIMHEKQKAEIEIELAPHLTPLLRASQDDVDDILLAPVHIIRRVIDRNKGSASGRAKGVGASTFYINDQQVNIKLVQKLVSQVYNIAIDNLCTFLPQDKVGSFSAFDPRTLLQETEKTLSGSQDLFHEHNKLIELEQKIRSSGSAVTTTADQLKTLQEENDRLEREKERMEERKRAEAQMVKLEQKRLWLKFDEARQAAVELKTQRDTSRAEMQTARRALKPLQDKQNAVSRDLQRLQARSSHLNADIKKYREEYEKQIRKSEEFQDRMDDEMNTLQSIDSLQRTAVKNMHAQETKVKDIQRQLEDYPPEEAVEESYHKAQIEIREKKKEIHLAKRKLAQIEEQTKSLTDRSREITHKLERMNDEKARRKERIFRQHHNLEQAYTWLEQNRALFRRQVWGPIVCEITTDSGEAAAFLEQHVANSVFKMFVVECDEDYNLLYGELREKRNISVNIQNVPWGELAPVRRLYSEGKMKELKERHGVVGYLDELFYAPDPVLQALRNMSSVQSVLVGSTATQESIDRRGLLDYLAKREDGRPELMNCCIFTNHMNKSYKYTSTVSRYSGKSSLRVDDITPARMLAPGTPPEEKAALQKELQDITEQIQSMEPQKRRTETEYNEILAVGQEVSHRLKSAQSTKQDLKNLIHRLKTSQNKLEEFREQAAKDHDAEKEATKRKLERHVKHSLVALETAAQVHDKVMKSCCGLAGVKMTEDGYSARARKIEDELHEKERATSALEHLIDQRTRDLNTAKQLMRRLKDDAESRAPLKSPDGSDLPLKAELEALPPTLLEIEASIDEARSKIDSITENPEVLRQYERRKAEIEEMTEELRGLSDKQDADNAALKRILDPWEAKLKNTVKIVNEKFEEYMKDLGCAGEVTLGKGDQDSQTDPSERVDYNFKEWGIEIRVKFRESSTLQVLSARVQSGGERSVSTIMYLMALQDLMVSPFKCVDEINQGLDDVNERKVFKRIVRNSTQNPEEGKDPNDHNGQYFLITPKLLPNLTDMETDNVTLLFVFNGSYNFHHYSDWKFDDFVMPPRNKRARVN